MNDEYNISQAFQRIEETLIKSMKRNLMKHLKEEEKLGFNWTAWQTEQLKALEVFKKQNKNLFKNDFSTINNDVEALIKQSFENGKLGQERVILQAIQSGNFRSSNRKINKLWNIYINTNNQRIKKKQLTRLYEKASQIEACFFKINTQKLNSLIQEATGNLSKAETSILRYANDQYRKIIYNAQVFANTGAGTVRQAIDMATQDFLSKGINSIEYSNDTMVNITSYAEMAIRTANKRAMLQGEGTKRQQWGVYTVLVPNRGGGCPYCIKFQGKVFIDDVWSGGTVEESKKTGYPLLSSAIKAKLFHPNCKDTIVTYYPGITKEPIPPTKEELEKKIQNYKNEQKLKYIDRNIEKYKRLELGSIDEENIEKYHNKRLQWQEYKKRFRNDKNATFYENVTNDEKSDIITSSNLFKKLGITENTYVKDNTIQEQIAKKLKIDETPRIVDSKTYETIKGQEIVRYVHETSKNSVEEVYQNSINGDIKYSHYKNSQYGRGIYFGKKSIEDELEYTYGKGIGKAINAKIDENAKILEFDSPISYIRETRTRIEKMPKELQRLYENERSLVYMLEGYDGIKINGKDYYCIYNRKVLIVKDE